MNFRQQSTSVFVAYVGNELIVSAYMLLCSMLLLESIETNKFVGIGKKTNITQQAALILLYTCVMTSSA